MGHIEPIDGRFGSGNPIKLPKSALFHDEIESLGAATRAIYSADMRADLGSVYQYQTAHSRRNYDENLFQVSVRVVGCILHNVQKMNPEQHGVISRFLNGEVFSLAVTRGIDPTTGEPAREAIRRIEGGYEIVVNKRLIGGLSKADNVICFVDDGTKTLLFEVPAVALSVKQVWRYGADDVSDLTGRVHIPESSVLAEDFMAKCILETALLEERDGLDAMNFVKKTWSASILDRRARIETLACRCAQKYEVFTPKRSLLRTPLILALKLITANTVNDLAARRSDHLSFADIQKAFTFGIAGGTSAFIEDQLWQRREDILTVLEKRLKELDPSRSRELVSILRLLQNILGEEYCTSDRDKRHMSIMLARIILLFVLFTLPKPSFRIVGDAYLKMELPAIRRMFVEILGSRILDPSLFASQEFARLCNK